MRLRQIATLAVSSIGAFLAASAVLAFQNPTQAPPDGNTPGVIWNSTAGQTASFNITGTGKITGGAAFGSYDPDPAYGVTTPNLYAQTVCLGAPADCRTAWPAGGGGAAGVSSVTAGAGITGGGSGDVTVSIQEGSGILVTADGVGLDFTATDDRYVNATGDTMTGNLLVQGDVTPTRLCLSGVCNSSWPVAEGGASGDITSVTAGSGLSGGGLSDDVTLSLDAGHDSGSSFDTRFVNVSGDTMTGALNLTALTATGDVQGNRVCIGIDCRAVWPADEGGDVTSVTAGPGLLGGGASGDLALSLDQNVTDAQYVNVGGDKMTGDLTISGANLTVGGGGAFGGYVPDPSYLVTTPSLYVGAPGSVAGVAYIDGGMDIAQFLSANYILIAGTGNFNGLLSARGGLVAGVGGQAAGYDLTTQDIFVAGGATTIDADGTITTGNIGAGGQVPSAGVGVSTQGDTYALLAKSTGPAGSSYAGYFEGDVIITGSLRANGKKIADIAESILATGPVEAGEVVVAIGLGDDGLPRFARASRANDTRVAGVISSDPTFVLAETAGRHPLAVSGIVKVKAVGPVAIGELLVSSDTPGYAMRCMSSSGCPGAVVGKALQDQKSGRGMILMMVMLR